MILADFRVDGRPRTKGSLDAVRRPDGSTYMRESIAQSKAWRAKVARACREHQLAENGALRRFEGPVGVRLAFWFPREQSVKGGPIPSHDTPWPTAITVGDVDKLARNVLDALSMPAKRAHASLTSALILDDSQVVSLSVLKRWEGEAHPAGVRILVATMDGEQP